jgi:selenocysteine-specific translation elongation factor
MKLSNRTFAIYAAPLTLILSLLISSSIALGQEGNLGPNNPRSSGASSAVNPETIDDASLKQTAKAYVKVGQILQNAQQALNSTSDDAQKQQLAQQVESKKLAAVKAEGLQPQRYNQVLQLAQADKTVQEKLFSYVKEVKNSPSNAQ